MRFLALKKTAFIATVSLFYTGIAFAQEAEINISQDPKIDKLLTYKTEINQETDDDNRFKIQIFNGNLQNAQRAKAKFESRHTDIIPKIKFETPNYKVWVGNFRTSLEADRYLEEIRKTFPNAFRFTPPKKKK